MDADILLSKWCEQSHKVICKQNIQTNYILGGKKRFSHVEAIKPQSHIELW